MEIVLNKAGESLPETDTTVIGCYQGPAVLEPVIDAEATLIAEEHLKTLLENEIFTGELGDTYSVTFISEGKVQRAILTGLGRREVLDLEGIRKAVTAAVREAQHIKTKGLRFNLIGHSSGLAKTDIARIIPEISLLTLYQFDRYKTEKKSMPLEQIVLYCGKNPSVAVQAAAHEGIVLGRSTVSARNLVNEPANILTPEELARRAESIGAQSGFQVEVIDEIGIEALGMQAYLEVARASENPPRLIVLRYSGDNSTGTETLGLVGKGLTYDSGGLSIKTNDGMVTMKRDMGGAAAVIGALSSIAQLKLKLNVVGVIAACENMISGKAFRPGDIIGSMAGKSIYVGSTDAEGRLTLIDAIHYAIEKEDAARIVDLATLTGAATHALGYAADVVVSNSDEMYGQLEKAALLAGEKKWRLPIFDEYRQQIKSDIADLTNSPGKPGSITAGAFIGEFVQDLPWVHIDIAPSAWVDENKDYRFKGGTGSGVRNLYFLAKGLSEKTSH